MFGKGYASFTVMKGNILVLAERGQLFLMAADEKAFRMIGMAEVCGKNWCSPAYADGKLYLRDKSELLCLELMAQKAR